MIKDFVKSQIKREFKHTPTNDQEILITALSNFVSGRQAREALLIKGYAGTGKTTLISALIRTLQTLQQNCSLMAPTGRAAKVLSNYSGKNAHTIHKEIYIQKSSADGFGVFEIRKNLTKDTIYIVDEASMISNQSMEISVFGSGRLLDDLISYVYSGKNCNLILIGDTAQLPPIGVEISPALDKRNLESYDLQISEFYLKEVVRQSEDSGILFNATALREIIENNIQKPPSFTTLNFNDISCLSGAELIETISDSYDKLGLDETIVICRSNKRANKFNQGIRSQILNRESEISVGDLLMVVKNNYFWISENEQIDFIANGDIVEVTAIKKLIERYGFRFAKVTIRLKDYENIDIDTIILLDTLHSESPALTPDENKKLFNAVSEDYIDIKSKKNRFKKIRENPYFNALQVKFAYAVTCHKAQGGQWKAVFADQGYIPDNKTDIEFLRWLYTAVTRPKEKLYLVNFNKDFIDLQ